MRLNAVFEQVVNDPVIVVDTLWIWLAHAIRKYTRPGNREAVGVRAGRFQQLGVLAITIVAVASDVTRIAVRNLAGRM